MTPLFSSALLRTQSDERLLVLVRDGQERAFEAIVDRYRKPLQRYCERVLSRSRAEDVVQQVLMKAWLALRDGTEVRSLKPWLYRIAHTTVLETAQTPGYDYAELRRSLLAPAGPEAELEQQTVIRRTLTGLAALPEGQREALLRAAFEGQSRAQIAEALGVSEGAVRQLLHRARASLRAAATAVTPLPLANWLATAGSSSAAGPALESGATGSLGIAGIAKASAVLATAGAVVTGSGGVRQRELDGARTARAETANKANVEAHRSRPATPAVSRPAPVHPAPLAAQRSGSNEEDGREAEHGDPDGGDRGQEGDSRESRRADGDGEHEVSRHESEGRGEPQSDEPSSPAGDSEADDERNSAPSGSGPGDSED